MPDNHTPEVRSYNMSRIRSKDTKPEELARKYLFAHGFRYRKNVRNLPGHPDIVLPKYKTVIFINGCFWHMHDCGRFKWPQSNKEYWKQKIIRNVQRDAVEKQELIDLGYQVLVIWECELTKQVFANTMNAVIEKLISNSACRKAEAPYE